MRRLLSCCIILAVLAIGCPTPVCDATDMRCNGNAAEICGSDGMWRTAMDCTPEGMVCCFMPEDPVDGIPEGYACLPVCSATEDGS